MAPPAIGRLQGPAPGGPPRHASRSGAEDSKSQGAGKQVGMQGSLSGMVAELLRGVWWLGVCG